MPNAFDYYLSGNPDDIRYECVEITHPSWTRAYRYVRNAVDGISVKHDASDTEAFFYEYYPLLIRKSDANDDLDQSFEIAVGDLGEELPAEIQRLRDYMDAGGQQKPVLNYREYISSQLTTPMHVELDLQLSSYSPTKQGSLFKFDRKQLNNTGTGLTFNLTDAPMMRAFI